MFVTTQFEIHSQCFFCWFFFCFLFLFLGWIDFAWHRESRSGFQISSASCSGKSKKKKSTQVDAKWISVPFSFFQYFSYLLHFFLTNMTHQINVCFKYSLFTLLWFRFFFFFTGFLNWGTGLCFFVLFCFFMCSCSSHNRFPLCSNVLPL